MSDKFTITERELKEIRLCMFYAAHLQHGTAGHNRMMLISNMAYELGFALDPHTTELVVPDNALIVDVPGDK